jgi:hypothetical protein
MTSLEGWSSTIELRPQQSPNGAADTGSVPSPASIIVTSARTQLSRGSTQRYQAHPRQASPVSRRSSAARSAQIDLAEHSPQLVRGLAPWAAACMDTRIEGLIAARSGIVIVTQPGNENRKNRQEIRSTWRKQRRK